MEAKNADATQKINETVLKNRVKHDTSQHARSPLLPLEHGVFSRSEHAPRHVCLDFLTPTLLRCDTTISLATSLIFPPLRLKLQATVTPERAGATVAIHLARIFTHSHCLQLPGKQRPIEALQRLPPE